MKRTEVSMTSNHTKIVKKCGVKFNPPSLMVLYQDTVQNKLRRRTIPLKDFTKDSHVSDLAQELRNAKKHREYLETLPNQQLFKLLGIILDHMKGMKLEDSIKQAEKLTSIDPNEDLNKVDDEVLASKKAVMNDSFERHAIRPGDPNFSYDVEVNFENAVVESSGWDSESDDDF